MAFLVCHVALALVSRGELIQVELIKVKRDELIGVVVVRCGLIRVLIII